MTSPDYAVVHECFLCDNPAYCYATFNPHNPAQFGIEPHERFVFRLCQECHEAGWSDTVAKRLAELLDYGELTAYLPEEVAP